MPSTEIIPADSLSSPGYSLPPRLLWKRERREGPGAALSEPPGAFGEGGDVRLNKSERTDGAWLPLGPS